MTEWAINDGWLHPCDCRPSPHFNQRPEGEAISLLVIHNISLPPRQFGSEDISDFFLGRLNVAKHPFFQQIEQLKVSAHCVIRRDGQVIQFVSFEQRAWHAGVSAYKGQPNCNDYSIGIELEGTDDLPYSDEQYTSLLKLTMTLQQHYSKISDDRIVGHCHIAPHRKTDPGSSFDWPRYRGTLAGSAPFKA